MSIEIDMSAINTAAHCAFSDIAVAQTRPSVLYRPALSIDGNVWCALYGANLQDGVAGFGRSPAEAMEDFDISWGKRLPAKIPVPMLSKDQFFIDEEAEQS